MAIILAGIDERVKALAFSNAALCQHKGYKYGKSSGFPYYLFVGSGTPQQEHLIENSVDYYDAIFAARRFKGPVFGTIGHEDLVCPAATVYAAYNQFKGPKVLVNSITGGHGTPNEYWLDRIPYFRHYLPNMKTPSVPWLTNTTYAANAGTDRSIPLNTEQNLSGQVFFNELANQNWSVRWEKVAGPGVVKFSDAANRQTSFTCSETGSYTFRFSAINDDLMNSDRKRVYIEDYVTINVF